MERSEIRDHRCRFEAAPGFRCASPGLRRRTKERIGSRTPTDAMSYFAGPYGPGRAWVARRTSIGVAPRFSPRGRVVVLGSASGHASWDVAAFVRRVLPAPACP